MTLAEKNSREVCLGRIAEAVFPVVEYEIGIIAWRFLADKYWIIAHERRCHLQVIPCHNYAEQRLLGVRTDQINQLVEVIDPPNQPTLSASESLQANTIKKKEKLYDLMGGGIYF